MKMNILKYTWRLAFTTILILSLTLNIALFVGGSISHIASSAFGAMTGIRTVAAQHASEVAQLGDELASERAAKRKLRSELSEATGQLTSERTVTRKLREELADPLSRVVTYRGKKVAMREAVDLTADRISKRAVIASSRNVGAMAGEAMPHIGVAVIVGVTALELDDLCDTLKDMNALKRAVSVGESPDEDEKTICAVRVPSKQELWETMKASPEMAWSAARKAVPTLEDVKQMEFPDVDWSEAWSSALSGSSNAWSATKDGIGSASGKAKEAGEGLLKRFLPEQQSDPEQ
jgi:hypothetical protein